MATDRDNRSRSLERQLAWVVAHPGSARAWSESGRISALAMATTLALGLIVHLVGYGIGNGAIRLPGRAPADLVSTLVSNLGIVLWTSVILVIFLEVLPARTRRRATRSMALAARTLREQGRPVPSELAAADAADAADEADAESAPSGQDRTLALMLERLTSIEQRLADRPD